MLKIPLFNGEIIDKTDSTPEPKFTLWIKQKEGNLAMVQIYVSKTNAYQ